MPENFIGLGVAGNTKGHLEQVGEGERYREVTSSTLLAPKGLFPWYVPNHPDNLGINPLSSNQLYVPEGLDIHPEPEVLIEYELDYTDLCVTSISARRFGIFNDASIRNSGLSVTENKNWGQNTKGISSQLYDLDKLSEGGLLDDYSIASWVVNSGSFVLYSKYSRVKNHLYFNEKLNEWILKKLRNPENDGPLEGLPAVLKTADYPTSALIGLGAPIYTKYGESNYLKAGDEYVIALFREPYERGLLEKVIVNRTVESSENCVILRQNVNKSDTLKSDF